MSHLALYREWRPQNFDEVVGQTQVVYPLRQAILRGETGHAYLFSGTRGTGKTSLAKIFAKAINCLEPENGNPCNHCEICCSIQDGSLLDVIEMDAASNNSVEDIRRLTDEIVFMPSRAKYKVYIIDEVHMLSSSAFNALLKTLEEPPAHAVFILATTEPQRIPATILSRCQRFEFHRIPDQDIAERLHKIAESKKINISDAAISQIAKLGDGALRDAISLLDQCQSAVQGHIERGDVLELTGLVEDDFLYDFSEAFFAADLGRLMQLLDNFQMSGKQLGRFVSDFSRFLRDLLVLRLAPSAVSVLSAVNAESPRLRALASRVPEQQLFSLIKSLGELSAELRWSGDPRTALDLLLIREIGETALAAVTAEPAEIPVQREAAEPAPLPSFSFPEAPETGSESVGSEAAASARPAFPLFPVEAAPGGEAEEEETYGDMEPELNDVSEEAALPLSPPQLPPELPPELPPATALAEEAPSAPEQEAAKPISEERWQAVREAMRRSGRIDLIMLLAPASVFLSGRHVRVVYPEGLRAHCKNVRRPQNLDVLSRLLRENGLPDAELAVELEGEFPEDREAGENVNPEEPAWVQKLRESGKKLGLELSFKDAEEEEPSPAVSAAEDPGLPLPPPEELPPLSPDSDELPF